MNKPWSQSQSPEAQNQNDPTAKGPIVTGADGILVATQLYEIGFCFLTLSCPYSKQTCKKH